MAYIPRSSFIPKEASGAIPMQVKRRRTVHIFGLIATIMLTVAILGSVGVFFYNDFLNTQLSAVKDELGRTSVVGTEEKIEEIKHYDRKLTVARELLDNHLAMSRLFEELENSTKETVRFTALEFVYNPGFDAELILSADSQELAGAVLQQMQFSEDGLFSDFFVKDFAIVTTEGDPNLGTLPTKKAVFGVTGSLKKDLLRYSVEDEGAREESGVPEFENTSSPETITETQILDDGGVPIDMPIVESTIDTNI